MCKRCIARVIIPYITVAKKGGDTMIELKLKGI